MNPVLQRSQARGIKSQVAPICAAERVRPQALLLGATLDTGNHGVSALASGTIASLLHAFEDSDIRILDYGRGPLASHARRGERLVPVEKVLLRFSKKPWQPNHVARLLMAAALLRLVGSGRLRSKLLSHNTWLQRLSETGICLSIAGGDSFSDIYGMWRLLYVALPQVLVLLLGRPLVLLPQTYGPFKSWPARCLARFILRRARLVYSRDREGLTVVEGLLGNGGERVRFGYDMGFALEPLPPGARALARMEEIKRAGPVVGFNVSGLLLMGGYTRKNMFGLKTNYLDLVRAILNFLGVEQALQVLLVPHVFGGEENPEDDVLACRKLLADLAGTHGGRLHFIEGGFDHHQTKYLIGQCDFFIGSRMHACIAALSQCVPAVGLAYSRKFAGVLDSIGGGARVVDLRELEERQVVAAIGEALGDKESLRGELQERVPKIRESVLNLFSSEEFKGIMTQEQR